MKTYNVTGLRGKVCVFCRILGMVLMFPVFIILLCFGLKEAAAMSVGAGFLLLEVWRGANVVDS